MGEELLYVEIFYAKPNKSFTEEQGQAVRYLYYNKKVICAECGKKRKIMWTLLCRFRCLLTKTLAGGLSDKVHPPLTPVCSHHTLVPDVEKKQKSPKKALTDLIWSSREDLVKKTANKLKADR